MRIVNVAHLEVPVGGADRSIASNAVDLIVGEVLDVVLTAGGGVAAPVAAGTAVPFALVNPGNGQEAFDLSGSFDGGGATLRGFAIDVDRDGRFDPARDTLLEGGRTPLLAPGAGLSLLAIVDPVAGAGTPTALVVAARCVTGSGPPGTPFAGQGDGGSDAVVGATGGAARLAMPFAGDIAPPSLVKTQSVRGPDGSSRPSPGAVVTYVLAARFAGPAAGARIVDPIPAGTVYVAGSLRLDAVPLSDAADDDPGMARDGAITVALGDITAAGTRRVQFQVTIQ